MDFENLKADFPLVLDSTQHGEKGDEIKSDR